MEFRLLLGGQEHGHGVVSDTTGADRLVAAAAAHGVGLCLANPGTTEMGLVAALDRSDAMRSCLVLFEGVATGAADGYARLTGTPAMTLLHLGPGLAYGLPNMHNAHRARSPMLVVVGDHTTGHLRLDAPLTTDVEGLARPMSGWVGRTSSPGAVDLAVADAWGAATDRRDVATLVVPADHQTDTAVPLSADAIARYGRRRPRARPVPDGAVVDAVAARLAQPDSRPLFLLGADALDVSARVVVERLCNRTGGTAFTGTTMARIARGGDVPEFGRLPYFPEDAAAALVAATPLVLVGARPPVAFFGYAGRPGELAEGLECLTLATEDEASLVALEALDEALAHIRPRVARRPVAAPVVPEYSDGQSLDGWSVGAVVAETMPHDAIVSLEGSTVGHGFFTASAGGARHDVLTNTGGAIGQGLPVALGAALAAPRRRVVAVQSDGSAQYTLQTLWTMARESTDVTVVLVSNRRYGILETELKRLGHAPGHVAERMTSLTGPALDWQATARGYGVPAVRAGTVRELREALTRAHCEPGPTLVEAVVV